MESKYKVLNKCMKYRSENIQDRRDKEQYR